METVTQVRLVQDGVDRYGKPVYEETVVEIPRAGVAPIQPEVDASTSQLVVIDGFTLYLPAGTVVEPLDEWIIRGERYRTVGGGRAWESYFSSWRPGVVVSVERGKRE